MNREMDCGNSPLAVVTGASSGIGEATARLLSQHNFQIVLIARRIERLKTLAEEIKQAGGQSLAFQADLSDEASREGVFRRIIEMKKPIQVFINNAGLGWYGYAQDMRWESALEMVQVNITAVVHFTLLVLGRMMKQNSGHIINVGSISGSLPSQGVALYGATKSFMDNFSTAIYRELRGTNVKISVVRAGPVLTGFCRKAATLPGGLRLPTERIGIPAEKVAEGILRLVEKPRRVAYIPAWLAITPWIEANFGWLIDRIGPLLLRRESLTETKRFPGNTEIN